MSEIIYRSERPNDYEGISKINDLAFGRPNEGKLIEALRSNEEFIPELSLVADRDGMLLGHILFYPIHIDGGGKKHPCLSLAPLAVLPEYQSKGIGGELTKIGLIKSREAGYDTILVIGHPSYYPKFGFVTASGKDIQCPFPAPDEAFMLIELREGALDGKSGMGVFPNEYSEFS